MTGRVLRKTPKIELSDLRRLRRRQTKASPTHRSFFPYKAHKKMVGERRFELPTSWSRTKRATKLRYSPNLRMMLDSETSSE